MNNKNQKKALIPSRLFATTSYNDTVPVTILPTPSAQLPRRAITRTEPRRTTSLSYRLFRGNLINAYLEGSIKKMKPFLKILSTEERGKVLNEGKKEFGMKSLLYMAVKEEKLEFIKFFWKEGARDEAALLLAKKMGGDVLRILEPKLSDFHLIPGYCELCCDKAALWNLNCGHSFCYDCIQKWIQSYIDQLTPTIPQCCNQPLTNHLEYFLDTTEIEQFQNRILRNTLSQLSGFKWCRNCENGFISETTEHSDCNTLICNDCGYQWCIICNLASHSEISCKEALERQSIEDRENTKWLDFNTQKCPKCCAEIQKNGGCPHMTCIKCKFEFCWICKSVWIPGELCVHYLN